MYNNIEYSFRGVLTIYVFIKAFTAFFIHNPSPNLSTRPHTFLPGTGHLC